LQTPESQTGPITIHCAAKLSTQWTVTKTQQQRRRWTMRPFNVKRLNNFWSRNFV